MQVLLTPDLGNCDLALCMSSFGVSLVQILATSASKGNVQILVLGLYDDSFDFDLINCQRGISLSGEP